MYSIFRIILFSLGRYTLMLRRSLIFILRGRIDKEDCVNQIIRIGNESVFIVFLTNIFTGMVLALQTAYGLERFGAKNYVGNIVALAEIRELAPVLTAIMLCGRVGASTAAELASMVVTEQIDAMRSLGESPVRKLVAPRLLAAVLVLPMLTVLADVIGIFGGWLVAVFELNIASHMFYNSVVNFVVIRDLLEGLGKSAVFGVIFMSIACYKGLNAGWGTAGVGRATTEAVVAGSIFILIGDFFLTKLLIML